MVGLPRESRISRALTSLMMSSLRADVSTPAALSAAIPIGIVGFGSDANQQSRAKAHAILLRGERRARFWQKPRVQRVAVSLTVNFVAVPSVNISTEYSLAAGYTQFRYTMYPKGSTHHAKNCPKPRCAVVDSQRVTVIGRYERLETPVPLLVDCVTTRRRGRGTSSRDMAPIYQGCSACCACTRESHSLTLAAPNAFSRILSCQIATRKRSMPTARAEDAKVSELWVQAQARVRVGHCAAPSELFARRTVPQPRLPSNPGRSHPPRAARPGANSRATAAQTPRGTWSDAHAILERTDQSLTGGVPRQASTTHRSFPMGSKLLADVRVA